MRHSIFLACAAGVCIVLGAACASSSTMSGGLPMSNGWAGDLRGTGAMTFIGGRAVMTPVGTDSTQITVTITGADTTSAHPWQLHQNECGATTGPRISTVAFPDISVSPPEGTSTVSSGTATAILPMAMPTSGKYSVRVFATPADTTTAIACADLVLGAPINVP